ncbi:MAG: hypothetical protein M3536_00260 [Actinomycetota bacterium]|nr:hypothetical protein [Actinomycetota bacterium]
MAFYIYGGNEFDAKPQSRPRPVEKPFDPELCGSNPGIWQHRRLKQPQCDKCRESYNAGRRRKWQERKGGAS